jgi:mRNA-degrading endonuclease RelE of RelBE toxin-antitoxin system
MNRFQGVLTEHAIADLEEVSKELREQIQRDLKTLQTSLLPSGIQIKRLRGFRPPIYRLRSGDYQVLYHIREDRVTVLRMIDRKLLERVIKRLNL